MNNVVASENGKAKEAKKTSETESYEDYEDDAMENGEESYGEIPFAGSGLSVDYISSGTSPSVVEAEVSDEVCLRDSYEERKRQLLKEKWLSVTGRRPRNIPNVKKMFLEEKGLEKVVFFGDKRPTQIEKQRMDRWAKMIAVESTRTTVANYGKIKAEARVPALSEGITCIRFERNGDSFTTAYRNGGTQVRKIPTCEVFAHLNTIESADKLPVRALRYHPTERSKLYIGGASGFLQIFDIETTELVQFSENIQQINNLDFNLDGHVFATGGRGGRVCVCDSSTLQVISIRERPPICGTTTSAIEDDYHSMRVYGLKFHPTETNLFATTGWDCMIKIWDVRVPLAVMSMQNSFVSGSGLDIQDDKILTASWIVNDSLKLWDFSSGRLLQIIPIKSKATFFEGEFLYGARFFNDPFSNPSINRKLIAVGGSGFNEVIVLHMDTGKIVATFPTYKTVLSLDVYGNLVAFGGKESLLRIGEVVVPNRVVF